MPKTVLRSGIRIHHQSVGEGPDVVMVHGITGNLAVWHLRLVPALCDELRLHTYDLRGHGHSDTPPDGYTLDDMAADLVDLLDALELERPAIVGHSYGADIALYLAATHPGRVSKVIAIESALPALEAVRSDEDWVGWTYWVQALEGAGHVVPADRRSDLRYLMRATIDLPKQWGPLRGLPRNPKPMLRLLEETTLPEDYRRVGSLSLERIAEIRTPVVLMYQERSAFRDTFDYLRAHLPDVEPILLPATRWGHFGPLEQPELVAQHVRGRLLPADADAVEVVNGSCVD
ncbi:alpha/beta hydrolase [Baekduia soli]|uniref:Alpha/beta hydrolase n=1 Tax=Baekduia soli TaxID=496014 RepID=A0A5B8U6P5_9ACTN|nr:alpha/beta hydrolase [Baekduia soli]QEC48332.1 alpha/beta hydrolase [Baekduia soli]